jgi:hypothetical protein
MTKAVSNPQMISAVLFRAIYHGALEILGEVRLKEFLKKRGDGDGNLSDQKRNGLSSLECQDLLNSLVSQFGLLTVQGICLRIGQVVFQIIRRNYPEVISNIFNKESLQPQGNRITSQLENLSRWLQDNMACQIVMENGKGNWILKVKLLELYSSEMVKNCFYFFNGILQECLEWMDNRNRYRIEMHSDSIEDFNSFRITIRNQIID